MHEDGSKNHKKQSHSASDGNMRLISLGYDQRKKEKECEMKAHFGPEKLPNRDGPGTHKSSMSHSQL